MLLIQNIEKLENQKVNQDWKVASIYKKASTYSITIKNAHGHFPYQRTVELSRFVEFNNNGIGHYFFFNEQGRKSHTSLTIKQIKDMDNILKALNWFTT
jgi:hypothetical protein